MKARLAGGLIASALLLGGGIGLAAGGTRVSATTTHYKVIESSFSLSTGNARSLDLKCPANLYPVGGGAHVGRGTWVSEGVATGYVSESDVDASHRGWETTVWDIHPHGNPIFTADVICASW